MDKVYTLLRTSGSYLRKNFSPKRMNELMSGVQVCIDITKRIRLTNPIDDTIQTLSRKNILKILLSISLGWKQRRLFDSRRPMNFEKKNLQK